MKIIDRNFEEHFGEIVEAIKAGKIFIYPTDTIYGLGGDATNSVMVAKIREIKKREEKPFSVIAPSFSWIRENCEVGDGKALEKLPGPYTLICKLRKMDAVVKEVNPLGKTLGVRIPDHWFSKLVERAGVPFVTTSVNLTNEPFMRKMDDVKTEILEQVDWVVYEGEKNGEPSQKIDLSMLN